MTSGTEVERRKPLATAPIVQLPSPPVSFEIATDEVQAKPRRVKNADECDDEFNGSVVMAEAYEDDDSFSYKAAKPKRSKSRPTAKSSLRVFSDEGDTNNLEAPTPRTRHLLDIINSRDVAMIKGLSGVGAKKARDLVEFLELGNDDDGYSIKSLQQLIVIPGLGKRTVERAYEGVSALLV